MTTVIDTNVIVALWDRELALSTAAQSGLDAAFRQGPLIVPGPVFAELMAALAGTNASWTPSSATPASS